MNTQNSYIALARKYRPKNFLELKGQDVLVKALSYSILNDRLAQSYLLTGIRGVGKTTSARIIAKTINCTTPIINGANIIPCEQCQNCESINSHNHPDILEIDAASQTGVDDVRNIIESSEYRPLLGRYKVFIIDEVHMLSRNAFNALLKLLEEPPAHVVFIFATTEVHKIPLTVISRCQRYDLKRFTVQEILALLEDIIKAEQFSFEHEALKIIALKSDGSARDATSMIDQAASLARQSPEEKISAELVTNMLSIASKDKVIEFMQHIMNDDAKAAIELIGRVYLSSSSLEQFIESVCDFVGYLNKAKILDNYQDYTYDAFSAEVNQLLSKVSLARLSMIWQITARTLEEIKISHNQLLTAEMLVIKAIYATKLPTFEDQSNREMLPRQGL